MKTILLGLILALGFSSAMAEDESLNLPSSVEEAADDSQDISSEEDADEVSEPIVAEDYDTD